MVERLSTHGVVVGQSRLTSRRQVAWRQNNQRFVEQTYLRQPFTWAPDRDRATFASESANDEFLEPRKVRCGYMRNDAVHCTRPYAERIVSIMLVTGVTNPMSGEHQKMMRNQRCRPPR